MTIGKPHTALNLAPKAAKMVAVILVSSMTATAVSAATTDCNAISNASVATQGLTPIAGELAAVSARSGLQSRGGRADVDTAIGRMQQEQCRAAAAQAAAAQAASSAKSGGSYRFDMTQNGKRMTADDFDRWMKANGVRVVGGATPTPAPAPAAAPPPAPAKKKKK